MPTVRPITRLHLPFSRLNRRHQFIIRHTCIMTKSDPTPVPLINLLKGWPHPSLLPIEQLQAAAQAVFVQPKIIVPALCYGPDEGDLRLRKAVAQWLADFYGQGSEPDHSRICITGGASQNLACILQTFTDPVYTRTVWIVSPGYMLAFRIFADAGLNRKMRAVPEDDEGIDIDFLRRELLASDKAHSSKDEATPIKAPRPWAKLYKHIIYAVPTFSNPSSRTMSHRRREALVRLARTHDALIITDDVYDHLQWFAQSDSGDAPLTRRQQPRLVDIDSALDGGVGDGQGSFGNAVSNGSFSKICAPGVRTGWAEAAPKFAFGLSQTGSSRSGGAPSQLTANFMAQLLEEGKIQERVYRTLQPTYARRWRRMMSAIEKELVPLGCRLPQSQREIVGGYFIWVHLPQNLSGSDLAERAKREENLIVAQGEQFEVPDDETQKFPHDIRLCFSWEDEDKLDIGIQRLARVIKNMLEEANQNNKPNGNHSDDNDKEGQGKVGMDKQHDSDWVAKYG